MNPLKLAIPPMLVGAVSVLLSASAVAQMPADYVWQHSYEANQQGYFPGRQKMGLEQQTAAGNFDNSPPVGGYYTFRPALPPSIATPQNGFVHYLGRERAMLGVSLSENSRNGVQITSVASGSPADRAGLRPGDRILGINQQPTNSYRDVIRIINGIAPQSQVVLHLDRNGQRGDVTATLGELRQQGSSR